MSFKKFSFILLLVMCSQVNSESKNGFKKSRIKQLSRVSDRFGYFEVNRNKVDKYSKKLGMSNNKSRDIHNWVEINDSKIGGGLKGVGKQVLNRFSKKKHDTNIGVNIDCNDARKISNTVIINKSSVGGSTVLGGNVNTGISLTKCRNKGLKNKRLTNKVTIDDSNVGGLLGGIR